MPGVFEYAEVSYTLSDLIVAAYNRTANTYGTPAAMASGQTLEVDSEHDTDKLQGYGVTTGLLSVARGAKLKFGGGGVDTDVMAILGGISNYTSGLTPNRMRRSRYPAGGAGLPYYGCIGVGPTDDGGILAIGLQACKLDKYPIFKFDGKTNKFNMWESDGYAMPILIGGLYFLHCARYFETAANWVAPATGADFLAFFTA